MNRPNKSSALWNVLDPDDPYDIKKSMIAKLPDHPPQPMGTHLELVCLLQAAEIERLSDYLTEINSKYREMERRELDRHSYEVQIKELAQKNISLVNLQKENERLKDFIRRQSMELEELQKKNMISINFETLQAKYEGLLNELRIARNQNEGAEKTISRLNVEVGEWRSRWQKGEQERMAFTSQFQIQVRQKLNIEIKGIKEKADERVEKMVIEIRQLKEALDSKNHEIQNLSIQRQQLVREIRLLEEKNRNKGNIEQAINEKNREIQRLNGIITEKNAKFEQAMASNQRLGGQLNILEERYRNIDKQREKFILRIKELEVYKTKSESFEKLQEKVAMMSMEIERLNGLNAVRARECADANGEIERLKFELRNVQNARQQLQRERQRIAKLQSEIEILRASESRTRIQADELQRVRSALNSKNEQIYILQQKLNSSQINSVQFTNLSKERSRLQQQLQLSYQKIENMKIALNNNQTNAMDLAKLAKDKSSLEQELQASKAQLRNYKNITESEISTLKSENTRYRQELDHNSVSRGEYEKYKVETDRLRAEIQRIRGQSVNIRKFFEQEKSHTLKLQNQRNSLLSENQNMLNELLNLKKEIENTKIMFKGFQEKERLLQSRQYELLTLQKNYSIAKKELEDVRAQNDKLETTVENIYNEIERLHQVLEIKVNENQKMLKDISQYEEKCRFYQSKLDNTANEREFYEKEISRLRGQLDNSAKMTNQVNRDLMNRLNEALMEKEKTDKILIQKDRLINEYTKEKDSLQKKLIEIQREFAIKVSVQEQLRKEKQQFRLQKQKYYEEIMTKQSTIYQLQTVIRQRETIIREKELIIKEKESNYRESDGKVKVWESRVTEWESRLKDAERGIQIREEETEKYRKENERLNTQIQRFSQELQEIVRQRQTIINENNQLKRRIQELSKDEKNRILEEQLRTQLRTAEEALFRERKQTQNMRSQSRSFEQSLNRQSRELQTARETIRQYQMKIVHIENTQTRVLQDRIKEYEAKLPERENLVIVLQRQIKQMEAQLESVVVRDKDALNNLHKYEEKISLLSVEIERLNTKLQEKARDCRQKENIIAGLNSRLNQPDHQLQDRIRQSQGKLMFYANQIEKLKKVIYERQVQINEKNNSIQQLTIKINSVSVSQDSQAVSRYKIEITNLQTALEEYENINMHTIAERDELFKVSHELKDQLDEQMFKAKELEGQLRGELNYRLEENRRFGQQLGQLKKREQTHLMKIEEYERNISRGQEKQLRLRITQLQEQIQAISQERQGLRNENANLNLQVNHLLSLNQQLSIKIGESSNYSRDEVSKLSIKIKQVNKLLQTRETQIGEWQLKYNSLYSAYEQLYNNYQITKEQYEKAFLRIKEYERMTIQIQENYQSIAVTLRNKEQEIYELKMKFKTDGDLYEKNIILSKEIDRLAEINKKYQEDVRDLRINLSDNTSLHKRIEQQLALLVILFSEVQSLRSRLTNSEKQCEQVRRSSIVPCRVDKSKQTRL